jgi:hypothetical protein
MSFVAWYLHKAEQCAQLAAMATNARERTKYEEEGRLWREIARDVTRQERSENGPH